jgi:hypothetical protein
MKQETYETLGVVENGMLKVSGRRLFEEALRRFPDGAVSVRISRARPKRSDGQTRFFHGVVIPLFAEHCGYELDEMKDVLALELIPKEITDMKTGEVRVVPGHTSALNTKEFNDLIERAQRLGASMGIVIPDPSSVREVA